MYKYLVGKNAQGKNVKRPVYVASDFTYDEYYSVNYLQTCTYENILPSENVLVKGWNTLYTSCNINLFNKSYSALRNTSDMVGVRQIFYQTVRDEAIFVKGHVSFEIKNRYYLVAQKDSTSNNYFYFSVTIIPMIRCLDADENDILSQANYGEYAINRAFSPVESADFYKDFPDYNLSLFYGHNWYVSDAPFDTTLARVDIVDAQEQKDRFIVQDFIGDLSPNTLIAYDIIFKSNNEFTIKPKFKYYQYPALSFYTSEINNFAYNQSGTPINIGSSTDASSFYGSRALSQGCLWFTLTNPLENMVDSEENETTDNDEVADSAGKVNSTGGGDGDFDDTSDEIDIPSPSESNPALTSGLVRMWRISRNGLTDLVEFLWDDSISGAIKKLFSNPKDCICNLMTFPYLVETKEAGKEIKLVGVDSGVTADPDVVAGQQIDCGSLDVNEYFGTFLDYQTNVSIYLPYIGIKSLNVNDVMDSNIHLVYNVDNQTGECVAFIKCNKFNQNLNSVMYSFSGNMGTQLPINSRDTSTQYLALLNATSQMVMGNYVSATNIAVTGLSPTIEKAGRLDSNSGNISVLKPYLIVERPMWQKPTNYGEYQGETAYIYDKLSNLSGYVEVEKVKSELNGVPKESRDRIIELLESGVYI
jgi:hypothetical protein